MAQGKQQNFGAPGLIFENLMSALSNCVSLSAVGGGGWVSECSRCANWAGRGTKSARRAEAPFPLIRSAACTTLDARH
jgi:hypothetical protein